MLALQVSVPRDLSYGQTPTFFPSERLEYKFGDLSDPKARVPGI